MANFTFNTGIHELVRRIVPIFNQSHEDVPPLTGSTLITCHVAPPAVETSVVDFPPLGCLLLPASIFFCGKTFGSTLCRRSLLVGVLDMIVNHVQVEKPEK